MNITLNDKVYKLYTEVLKGKNVIAYLELVDILQDDIKTLEDLKRYQIKFILTFLNNKISISQLEKKITKEDLENYSSILYYYVSNIIDDKLIKIFKLETNLVEKEESIFDKYDRENNYEEIKLEKTTFLKDIIYSIYDYALENGNSFQDINEKINFIEYLDYFDFIINRKPKEEVK